MLSFGEDWRNSPGLPPASYTNHLYCVPPLVMQGWYPMIAHILPAFSFSFSFQFLIAFAAQVSEASSLNRSS